MVRLYMHFKVGRSGETWDQRNKEQGSCLTHSRPRLRRGGILFHNDRVLKVDETTDAMIDLNRTVMSIKSETT